jgi:hypothetical protein
MTAVASRSSVTRMLVPPIAGFTFEYRVSHGIPITSPDTEVWSGSGRSSAPIIVDHRLGGASIDGLHLMMQAPPWSAYYADDAGRVCTRFHEIVKAIPARLLRTIEPGARYEVLYERHPTMAVEQRDVELALFTMVLAARRAGLLAHGCAYVLPNGCGVLSPGMSGNGKSTLGRILAQWGDVPVLNDDRIALLDNDDGGIEAWGTPWPGQGGVANPAHAPLAAIAFIRQAERCEVRSISRQDAARRLYRMLALPLWSGAATADALDFVERMVSTLPLLELAYPATEEASHWIVSTLMEETRHG